FLTIIRETPSFVIDRIFRNLFKVLNLVAKCFPVLPGELVNGVVQYTDALAEKFFIKRDLPIRLSCLLVDLHEERSGCAARTRSFIQLTLVEFQALCVVSRIMRKS